MTLPAYDPEATCPQCGFGDVSTAYCEKVWSSDYCSGYSPNSYGHLDRRCGRCGHRWKEATLQATEQDRLISDLKAIANSKAERAAAHIEPKSWEYDFCAVPLNIEVIQAEGDQVNQVMYSGFCQKRTGHDGAHEASVTVQARAQQKEGER